jgi:hypothetical protein
MDCFSMVLDCALEVVFLVVLKLVRPKFGAQLVFSQDNVV